MEEGTRHEGKDKEEENKVKEEDQEVNEINKQGKQGLRVGSIWGMRYSLF